MTPGSYKFKTTFINHIVSVGMVLRIIGPKVARVLFPKTCEYVTLSGKRNLANMIKIIDHEIGRLSGLSE